MPDFLDSLTPNILTKPGCSRDLLAVRQNYQSEVCQSLLAVFRVDIENKRDSLFHLLHLRFGGWADPLQKPVVADGSELKAIYRGLFCESIGLGWIQGYEERVFFPLSFPACDRNDDDETQMFNVARV